MKFPVFSLLAGNFGPSETGSLLTAPSSGESVSIPELLSKVENPGFPGRLCAAGWRPGRQRHAGQRSHEGGPGLRG
jgi:hypothetical protein